MVFQTEIAPILSDLILIEPVKLFLRKLILLQNFSLLEPKILWILTSWFYFLSHKITVPYIQNRIAREKHNRICQKWIQFLMKQTKSLKFHKNFLILRRFRFYIKIKTPNLLILGHKERGVISLVYCLVNCFKYKKLFYIIMQISKLAGTFDHL